MKKFALILFVCSWVILSAQSPVKKIRYYDTGRDSTSYADSLSALRQSNYTIGLDTAYLKSIQQVDTLQLKFMEGVNLFNTKKYYDALLIFEEILQIPPFLNHFLSATEMMVVKTYLRLGNYRETIARGYEFETKYEGSKYLDDVRYTIADALMSEGRYSDALLYYLNVMEITDSKELLEKCRQSLDITVDIFLSGDDLEILNRSVRNHPFFNFILSLKIIEKNYFEGYEKNVEENLGRIRKKLILIFFRKNLIVL